MKRSALVLTALLLAAGAAHAQIYQWKDENGKTVISDKPPAGKVQQSKTLSADSPAPTPAAAQPPSLADRELEFRKRQQEKRENTEKQQKDADQAARKKENCERARRALQAFESGERIAIRNDSGEREFLDDAQREKEAARQRQAVKELCQ